MKKPVFESGCSLIEVTSIHRPDTDWSFTDSQQHIHQWYTGITREVARHYHPMEIYVLPSLKEFKDPPEVTEDGDEINRYHYECEQCGERVTPGYRSDDYKRYTPGFFWYRIDGQVVTEEKFYASMAGMSNGIVR